MTSLRAAGSGSQVRGPAPAFVTRRGLEMTLGGLWLLDGALQFQPYMFTRAFLASTLGMANMGLPGPLSSLLYRVSSLVTPQPVLWNAAFASLQVLIGAGLLWAGTARVARPVSIGWALAVWLAGAVLLLIAAWALARPRWPRRAAR